MSPTWVTFLFEAANFLLLAAALGWLFFRPVRDALERRRSQLESEQRAAADARAAAEREEREAHAKRTEFESSLDDLRERIRQDAEAERARVVEAARAQMQRERESLKNELAAQRRAQAGSIATDAAFAAREIVVRLLGEIEGPDLEDALQRAACAELEALRSSGALAPIVVESARALDDGALAELARAAGVSPGDVSHHLNADLAAGMRVLSARGVVDASASGLAAQAERVLVGQLERESADE